MLGPIRECQTGLRRGKRWVVRTDFLVDLNRLIKLTIIGVSHCLCEAYDWREWIKLIGPVGFIDRLLCPATDVGEALGKPLMGGGVAGIELKRLSELSLAAGKIPTVLHLVDTQIRMRARQCRIEFQSFFGRGIRLGDDVVGITAIAAK